MYVNGEPVKVVGTNIVGVGDIDGEVTVHMDLVVFVRDVGVTPYPGLPIALDAVDAVGINSFFGMTSAAKYSIATTGA